MSESCPIGFLGGCQREILEARIKELEAEVARMRGAANGYAHGMLAASEDAVEADEQLTLEREITAVLTEALWHYRGQAVYLFEGDTFVADEALAKAESLRSGK